MSPPSPSPRRYRSGMSTGAASAIGRCVCRMLLDMVHVSSGCRPGFAKSSHQARGTRYPLPVACLLEHVQGSFDVLTCLVMSSARMSRHRQVEEDVGFPARVTEC